MLYEVITIGDGFLAIMGRPFIDESQPASLRNVARLGIQQVVSLLTPSEARSLGLDGERREAQARGMVFVSFPIADMGTPDSVANFAKTTLSLFLQIESRITSYNVCYTKLLRS